MENLSIQEFAYLLFVGKRLKNVDDISDFTEGNPYELTKSI